MLRSVKAAVFQCLEVLLTPGLPSARWFTNVEQDDKTWCRFKHLTAGLLQNKICMFGFEAWRSLCGNSLQEHFLHHSPLGLWFWWEKSLDDVCPPSPGHAIPITSLCWTQPESEAVQLYHPIHKGIQKVFMLDHQDETNCPSAVQPAGQG